MRPADLAGYRATPAWLWLTERMWRVEHAFERAKAARREQDTTYRIFFVLMMFAAAFATLGVMAATKALWPDDGKGGWVPPAVARADVVDRNGDLLAVDIARYGVYLDPDEVWDKAETRLSLTTAMPKLDAARIDRAFATGRRTYLLGELTPAERDIVHDLGLPGVEFQKEEHRFYPAGQTAAHLIGFTDTGGKGLAGAERALDDMVKTKGARGEPVALSIDLRVQGVLDDEVAKAVQEFQALDGAGIVLDTQTGEVLAMTSYPTYDPNDVNHFPMADRVNHMEASVFEAGSVFKVFTLAMALDAGVATPASTFDVSHPLVIGRQTIHDFDKGDHVLTLTQVFTHSSNIGAATIALRAGAATMDRYIRSFGLYAAVPIGMAESARPLLPHREHGVLTDNAIASMAFGQGISVSPLAVATGIAAVVNDGVYVTPTIRKLDSGERPKGRRVVSSATSQTMLRFMRHNITDKDGSGGRADVPGYAIGGKTGTAQKAANGRYLPNVRVSSFAGVFPTDGPPGTKRYLVYILLDEPHPTPKTYGFATAGWNAAPTVGQVINRIAPFLGVAREPTLPTTTVAQGDATAIPAGHDE